MTSLWSDPADLAGTVPTFAHGTIRVEHAFSAAGIPVAVIEPDTPQVVELFAASAVAGPLDAARSTASWHRHDQGQMVRLDIAIEQPASRFRVLFDAERDRLVLGIAARRRAIALVSSEVHARLGAAPPLALLDHCVAIMDIVGSPEPD